MGPTSPTLSHDRPMSQKMARYPLPEGVQDQVLDHPELLGRQLWRAGHHALVAPRSGGASDFAASESEQLNGGLPLDSAFRLSSGKVKQPETVRSTCDNGALEKV